MGFVLGSWPSISWVWGLEDNQGGVRSLLVDLLNILLAMVNLQGSGIELNNGECTGIQFFFY